MKKSPLDPECIIHNARIYTVDPRQPWAEAAAIQDGKFVAVGTNQEIRSLAGPRTGSFDCGGRLALPGLCDAHIHFYDFSLGRRQVQLAGTRSKAEMLQRIAARAERSTDDDWIVGQGWNESFWGETAFPTRRDLDSVTGKRPAIFLRSDMHAAVANSAALRIAGIDRATSNPDGGIVDKDANGDPTGVLREQAIGLVTRHVPEPTADEIDAAVTDGTAALHRMGITAIHDQRIKDGDDGPNALASYQRLRRRGDLRLRVNCNVAAHNLPHLIALGLRTGMGDDRLRLGHVKVFCDGSLGSRTAWMLAPFEPVAGEATDNSGVVVTSPAQMAREFRQATAHGFPISVHAIGDRANRVCLDIFEELADGGLQPSIPHRIEHVQTIHPDDVPRLARLNVTASVQPIHALDDMDTADLFLGARAAHTYTFRSLLDAGTRLALGSDAPVADPNPFLGIHAALVRKRLDRMERPVWHPDQRISLEAAIHGYTMGAAEATGWQQTIGSVTPGKRADLVVLDRDLFAIAQQPIESDEVAGTQVVMTLFDGTVVFHNG